MLTSHLYGASPLMYSMYGRHPALLANTVLNSYYTPYSTPFLY